MFFPVTIADVQPKALIIHPQGQHIGIPTVFRERERISIDNVKNASVAKSVQYKNVYTYVH